MLDPKVQEEENYKAKLRREEVLWRSLFDHMLLSDRAAVDIGLLGLRTVTVANAGAIVALLAFMGPVWGKSAFNRAAISQVLAPLLPFIVGLVLAMFCCLFAYLYQSAMTARLQDTHMGKAKDPYAAAIPSKAGPWIVGFGVPMMASAVGALIAFVWGVFRISSSFPT